MTRHIDTRPPRHEGEGGRGGRAPEYTVTRCETCGQTLVILHDCRCGHSILVHDVRGGRRTGCGAGAGLVGCPCKRYEEAA